MKQISKEQVREFVLETFRHFDILDDVEFFLPRMNPNLRLISPEGTCDGHDGFKQWYKGVASGLLSPTQHIVSDSSVELLSDFLFEAKFKVRFIAETKTGEKIDNDINEYWLIELNPEGKLWIRTYVISK